MNIRFLRTALVATILLVSLQQAQAQPGSSLAGCGRSKTIFPTNNGAQPAIADIREEDYDVVYVKLDLQLDNLSPHVAGSVHTRAKTTGSGMSVYVFELLEEYTIDSLKFNGILLPVTTSGFVRSVALPWPVPAGTLFDVLVYYQGEATTGGAGFFSGGIRTQTATNWNAQVTYTLSEPYGAKDWWPCKQSLQDKLDSSDVWVTVPAALKAGSNGLLENVTALPGGFSRYEWKNRNRIDYYLISIAAGPYVDYSYYVHFNGSSDSMLVQNYIYDDPGALPFYKNGIDSTAVMINYFSSLFGRYPFWKEKYGHCITPLGGGMEHQTMTTLNHFGTSLVAHELGHQWFGDHVTCGTWGDIWLNEGFATYLDYLYRSYALGSQGPAFMDELHTLIMSDSGGSVYCTDTTSVGRIFSSRLSYGKGAAIIHTLRFVYNNDVLFYNMLRNYQQQYGGHTATTDQFKAVAAAALGVNLDVFFDQWVYREGFPIYNASWNQVNNQVLVRLEQSTSMPSSVTFFKTPLEIKLYAAGTDTVVRVEHNTPAEVFAFLWPHPVDSIALDPANDIINRTDSIRRDFSLLSISGFDTTLFLVYPNPASDHWMIEGMPNQCELVLYDVSGRLVWKGSNGSKNAVKINNSNYSKGIYLLHVSGKDDQHKVIKLVKT